MMTVATKRGKPLPRQQALIVAIVLAAIGVTIVLGNRTHQETRRLAAEQFNRQQLILARSAAAGIETYFREISTELLKMAQRPDVQRLAPESLECMRHVYRGVPPRTSVRRLDRDGVLRLIYPFEGWRGALVGRDYGDEAYFQTARDTGRAVTSGIIVNEQGEMRIMIVVPVYLNDGGETAEVEEGSGATVTPLNAGEPKPGRFAGVLIGSLGLDTIAQDFVSSIVSGQTGYAWLLNEEGVFLAHYEQEFVGRSAFAVRAEMNPEISYTAVDQLQRRMMAGEGGVGRYLSGWHRGRREEIEKLVSYAPVHVNDRIWSVAVCAPVEEVERITRLAYRSQLYTLGFVIVALLTGGTCLLTVAHRHSRSLEREVARRTEALRETRDYLDNLIRSANAPIMVWSPERKVTLFNQAFERMSGWTGTEIMEQPVELLFPADSRSDSLRKMESASGGEYWENVEISILRKGGEIRLGLWNSANIYAEDGATLVATITQGADITERVRAEEALRENEERFRAIFETAQDSIFIKDRAQRYTQVNPAMERLFGLPAAKLIGRMDKDLFGEEAGAHIREVDSRVLDGEIIEEEHTKPVKGIPITFHVIKVPMRDGSGEIIGLAGIARDITERVRAEEALRKSEERYHSLFDGVPVGLYRTTPDGQILDANLAAMQMLGYPDRESLLAANVAATFVDAEGRRRWQALVEREGVVRGFESQLCRRDGTIIWVDDNGRAVYDAEGRVLYYEGSLEDITERKRAEEERERLLVLEREQRELAEALRQATAAVSSTLDLDQVLDQILEQVRRVIPGDVADIMLIEGDHVRIVRWHGYERFGVEDVVQLAAFRVADTPTLRHMQETGEAMVIPDTATYADWIPMPGVGWVRSYAAAPIRVRDQVIGFLNVDSATPGFFNQAHADRMRAFANQVSLALANARLYEQVYEGRERLRSLSRRLVEVQEAERRRIARELHDEIGQALTAVGINLHAAQRLLDTPTLASHLEESISVVQRTLQQVRNLSLDLRPSVLDDLGLVPALRWYVDRQAQQVGFSVQFTADPLEKRLAPDFEIAGFRIVQEALTNVVRHAQAQRVRVELWQHEDELQLIIRDDGVGFDVQAALERAARGASLGLPGMQERAVLVGGQIEIESAPGRGTEIRARFPLPLPLSPDERDERGDSQ